MLFNLSRIRSSRRQIAKAIQPTRGNSLPIEALENRLLMSTNAWKAAVSGDWDNKAMWSLGHVPLATEDVTITLPGTYTVTHTGTTADVAKSLTISAAVQFNAGTINVSGAVKVTGGSLTFKGGHLLKGTLSTSGTGKILTTVQGGALDGATLASNITMATGSYLALEDNVTFTNNAILTANNSQINLYDETTGGSNIAGTGQIVLGGTSGSTLNSTNNHGHNTVIGANITVSGYGSLTSVGTINDGIIQANTAGKTLAISGSLTNSGIVRATAGTLQIKNPSTFTNKNTISAAQGTVLISGAFNAGTGILAIALDGTTAGTNYGLINVAGALTLGGTLDITLVGTYIPASGTTFTPLKYTSHTGSFATTTLPTSSTLTYTPTYGSTSMTLAVATKVVPPTKETLTMSYTEVEIATNSAFTTGVQTITLNSTGTNNITIPVGDYFRFGVDALVTGGANPAYNDAWDKANRAAGNPAQPANLGLGVIAMKVYTTNGAANVMEPISVPNANYPEATAVIGPQNAPAFAFTAEGNVSGGDVGNPYQIGGGNLSAVPTTQSGVNTLALYTKQDTFFTGLDYKAFGTGKTTITPFVDTTALNFWVNTGLGTVNTNGTPATSATYQNQPYDASKEVVDNAAPINITVS